MTRPGWMYCWWCMRTSFSLAPRAAQFGERCISRLVKNEFFPGKGWTDLVAAFVGAWVQGLVRVAHGSSQQERVPFFDGPFAVDISMRQKGFVDLSFVRVEKSTLSRTVDIKHLLAHGHSVGSELLSLCRQRQWNNRGTVTERSMTFCSSRMFPGQGYD
jgi:hypothetical protein